MELGGGIGSGDLPPSLTPHLFFFLPYFALLSRFPLPPLPTEAGGASATYLSPRSDRTALCLATRRSDATHARRSLEAGAPSLVRRSGNPSVSFEFSQ